MNAESRALHARLKAEVALPEGWVCELCWPWREHTHLVAPRRKGGVIVKVRTVRVELAGDVCTCVVDIIDGGQDHFKGRRWRERLVRAVNRAIWVYEKWVKDGESSVVTWQSISWQELSDRPKTHVGAYRRTVDVGDIQSDGWRYRLRVVYLGLVDCV